MIVTEPRSTLPATNRKTAFRIFRLGRMEIFFEEPNHAFTRIAVLGQCLVDVTAVLELNCTHRTQEGVIIANAIQTLTNVLLTEIFSLIT